MMPSEEQIRRAQEQRFRFLAAIYDREERGERYPDAGVIAAEIGVDAEDWTAIQGVTEPLRQAGLIDGSHTAELGLVTVGLTTPGRTFVEDRLTGNGEHKPASARVGDISIGGTGHTLNLAQFSPGAQQSAQFTSYDLRKISEWADDVDRRAPDHGLQPEDLDEVRQQVVELRKELDKLEPDHAKLRFVGRLILRILGSTSGSLASMGLIEAGQSLFG
jgi:hypothetical protein